MFTLLSILLCLVVIIILPIFLYMAPTLGVMLAGPPEHLLSPDAYARFMVSNAEDLQESEIDIVQIKGIEVPEVIWVVFTRYELSDGVHTRLLSYEDRKEGTLHIYPAFFEDSQSTGSLEATIHRYGNSSGSQFSVHGNILDEEVTQIIISMADEWNEEATIVDDTFVLIAPWPNKEMLNAPLQVTAFNDEREVLAQLLLSSTK